MQDLDAILRERRDTYGDFVSLARLSQAFVGLMQDHPAYCLMPAYHREALEMIQHKVARLVNGDPSHIDGWSDIAGYALLVADHLKNGRMS